MQRSKEAYYLLRKYDLLAHKYDLFQEKIFIRVENVKLFFHKMIVRQYLGSIWKASGEIRHQNPEARGTLGPYILIDFHIYYIILYYVVLCYICSTKHVNANRLSQTRRPNQVVANMLSQTRLLCCERCERLQARRLVSDNLLASACLRQLVCE